MLKRIEAIVASAVLALVVYTTGLSALALVQTGRTVSNTGSVKAVGVGVYWDYACTSPVSSIPWGMLESGSNKNVTCYIRNEGNSDSTLSMYTLNWSPSNASDYITLGWDYSGQSISPDEVVQVTFTLSISASIEGITSFNFDITIVGSG